MQTLGFFSEKKLLVFYNIPLSSWVKDSELQAKQELILKTIENKNENIIVVFYSANPDKRGKLYKYLTKNATSYLYEYKNDQDKVQDILSVYNNLIDYHTADFLLKIKWWDADKAFKEIEKLSISKKSISKTDIQENIIFEWEENIFFIIDLILAKKISQAISEISNTLLHTEVMPFYYGLLSNIRNTVYMQLMEKKKVSHSQILSWLKLWNKWFLVWKRYAMWQDELRKLYNELLALDSDMKLWKLSYLGNEALANAIKLVLLKHIA